MSTETQDPNLPIIPRFTTKVGKGNLGLVDDDSFDDGYDATSFIAPENPTESNEDQTEKAIVSENVNESVSENIKEITGSATAELPQETQKDLRQVVKNVNKAIEKKAVTDLKIAAQELKGKALEELEQEELKEAPNQTKLYVLESFIDLYPLHQAIVLLHLQRAKKIGSAYVKEYRTEIHLKLLKTTRDGLKSSISDLNKQGTILISEKIKSRSKRRLSMNIEVFNILNKL